MFLLEITTEHIQTNIQCDYSSTNSGVIIHNLVEDDSGYLWCVARYFKNDSNLFHTSEMRLFNWLVLFVKKQISGDYL